MTQIREYILGIVAAAILCSIVLQLTKNKSANGTIIKTACGIVMTICIFSPLLQFKLDAFSLQDLNAFEKGEQYITEGYGTSMERIRQVIKQRSEAYILQEASYYDCALNISVTISDDDSPKPVGVSVQGNVSPAIKQKLQSIIERDLGIPMELQVWS